MFDDRIPEPEPSGVLVPPPRTPPVALATADALPPRRPSPPRVSRDALLRELVHSALDALDQVGDSIAHAVGLR